MIKGYEKLRIPDLNKTNDFFIEVNWVKEPKIQGCKILRVTFPNGEEAYVKKDHFYAILFAIGNESEQRKMIPQTVQKVKWFESVLSVKAKKDIRKGENITFPIKLSIPMSQEVIHS